MFESLSSLSNWMLCTTVQGSKVLRGEQQSYIIAPLSSIVDERYTVRRELATLCNCCSYWALNRRIKSQPLWQHPEKRSAAVQAYFEWVHPHGHASSGAPWSAAMVLFRSFLRLAGMVGMGLALVLLVSKCVAILTGVERKVWESAARNSAAGGGAPQAAAQAARAAAVSGAAQHPGAGAAAPHAIPANVAVVGASVPWATQTTIQQAACLFSGGAASAVRTSSGGKQPLQLAASYQHGPQLSPKPRPAAQPQQHPDAQPTEQRQPAPAAATDAMSSSSPPQPPSKQPMKTPPVAIPALSPPPAASAGQPAQEASAAEPAVAQCSSPSADTGALQMMASEAAFAVALGMESAGSQLAGELAGASALHQRKPNAPGVLCACWCSLAHPRCATHPKCACMCSFVMLTVCCSSHLTTSTLCCHPVAGGEQAPLPLPSSDEDEDGYAMVTKTK